VNPNPAAPPASGAAMLSRRDVAVQVEFENPEFESGFSLYSFKG
jgi:hypothetical protein